MSDFSIVQDYGPTESSCGYCGGDDSSKSHGMWAHKLSCTAYGALIDRGWRRAGNWCYKPNLGASCCQQYTIRLDSTRFTASKAQRRVLRRLKAWLEGSGEKSGGSGKTTSDRMDDRQLARTGEADEASEAFTAACSAVLSAATDDRLPLGFTIRVTPLSSKQAAKLPTTVRYTSPSAFPAAAAARRVATSTSPPSPQFIAAAVAEALNKAAASDEGLNAVGFERAEVAGGHVNFHVRGGTVPGATGAVQEPVAPDTQVKRARKTGGDEQGREVPAVPDTVRRQFGLAEAQQGEQEAAQRVPGLTPMTFLCANGDRCQLTAEMERSQFNEEEFLLYKKYQTAQHGDKPEDISRSSYKRFLVENPFPKSDPKGASNGTDAAAAPPCGYGAFHIKYRLDGRLIAVSVVDVLPACLSSKYFFWDPDYAALSLGKFSALFEIAWVKEMQKQAPKFRYYYLGFYIHSCSKMRYKADYAPSDLLCPRHYVWVPYSLAAPALDASPSHMVVLSDLLLPDGSPVERPSGNNGTTGPPTNVELSPKLERSSNSRESFSAEEILSTALLEDKLTRLGNQPEAVREALMGRIQAWYSAVGSPAKSMLYVLYHIPLP